MVSYIVKIRKYEMLILFITENNKESKGFIMEVKSKDNGLKII